MITALNNETDNRFNIPNTLFDSIENLSSVRRKELISLADSLHIPRTRILKLLDSAPKVSRGVYNLSEAISAPMTDSDFSPSTKTPHQDDIMTENDIVDPEISAIPNKNPNFVGWGCFRDIQAIVESNKFFPTFISGESGNGKTMFVEQVCAKLKRKFIRVQISPETDEADLIGGFRLENGDTVFSKGPVIRAMEESAILLLDEIDRGTNKIMCLQGIMEGKPFLIKKTGEVVKPQPGFNIIATGNTRGRGSSDGRFIAASILDEAFLERFPITVIQPYPSKRVESTILQKLMNSCGYDDKELVDTLIKWATVVRQTYDDGGVDQTISTRRLCQIVEAYQIFQPDVSKAIEMCTNRFDDETREAFLDLFTKIRGPVENNDHNDNEEGGELGLSGKSADNIILDDGVNH